MLVVVSPAKKLNMSLVQGLKVSEPYFKKNVDELVNVVRDLSAKDLENLMDISPKLAELNRDRFKEFGNQQKKAAAFAFAGDTYKGLSIEKLEKEDLDFAQKHLRILSGLYGVLRPLDLMKPYRLEMGTKLNNPEGKNLYQFWGDIIVEKLNEVVGTLQERVLVNLASNEYSKSINFDKFQGRVITPVFKEYKNGEYKVIGLHSKRARGLMTRYIIKNQITLKTTNGNNNK